MIKIRLLFFALCYFLCSELWAATLIHDYQFTNSLADSLGGPSLGVLGGGSLSGGYYHFAANQGLSLSGGLANTATYSIRIKFRFNTLGVWQRIINYNNVDYGMYTLSNYFNFYPYGGDSTKVFTAGTDVELLLTRDGATKELKIYRNGSLDWTGIDSNNYGISNSNYLRFFVDDGSEAAAGAVDYIQIYDGVVNGTTPTPALSTSNTNFGNVRVGTSVTASVTVTNSGASGSTLTGTIGAASGSEFSPTSGTQSFSLGQNASNSRTFTYTPSARGADSTTISINSNATNTTATLTGTGVSPVYSSSISSGSTIDFGIVDKNSTATRTLSIQNLTPDANLGNLTNLTILSATISGLDSSYYSIENFTPGTILVKNGTLDMLIRVTNNDHIVERRDAVLTIVTDANAALGMAGNIYTYNLTAYLVPESSSFLFLSIASVFFCFTRQKFSIRKKS